MSLTQPPLHPRHPIQHNIKVIYRMVNYRDREVATTNYLRYQFQWLERPLEIFSALLMSPT
jgi:hypothetical protein